MKLKFLPLLVILSLLTLAIFSIWGMDMSHPSHSICPITTVMGECPEAGFAMYTGHLTVLDYFAQPKVELNIFTTLFLVILSISIGLLFDLSNKQLQRYKGKVYQFYKSLIAPLHRFISWFIHHYSRLPKLKNWVYEVVRI